MTENSPTKSVLTNKDEDIVLEPTIIAAFLSQSKGGSIHPGGPFTNTFEDTRSECSESDTNFSSRVKMPPKSNMKDKMNIGQLKLDFSKLKK